MEVVCVYSRTMADQPMCTVAGHCCPPPSSLAAGLTADHARKQSNRASNTPVCVMDGLFV